MSRRPGLSNWLVYPVKNLPLPSQILLRVTERVVGDLSTRVHVLKRVQYMGEETSLTLIVPRVPYGRATDSIGTGSSIEIIARRMHKSPANIGNDTAPHTFLTLRKTRRRPVTYHRDRASVVRFRAAITRLSTTVSNTRRLAALRGNPFASVDRWNTLMKDGCWLYGERFDVR